VAVGWQPNQVDWQLRLGTALAQSGRLEDAEEHFRAAVALDPYHEAARSQLNRAIALLEAR
jgi:Flp pilus assembly protein TadD